MKARSLLSIAGLFGAIVGSASLLDAAETAPKPAFFMHGVVDGLQPGPEDFRLAESGNDSDIGSHVCILRRVKRQGSACPP